MRVGGSGRAVQSFARMPADPHGELLLKHAFRLDPHPADHVIVSLAAGLAVGVGTIKERYVQMRREAARQQKCEELHRDKKRRVHLETPLAGAACGIQPHISNASSVATSRAPSFDGADTLERLLAIEAAVASRAPSLDSTADSLESMMALEAASEDEAASEAATEAATALSTADSVAPPVADSQRLDGVRAAGAPLASERRPASSVAGTADALMPADAPAPNGQIVEANTYECTVVTALMAMKDAGASSTPPRGSTDGSSQPGGAVLPRVRTPLLPGARLSAERIHALARGTLQHLGRVQVVLEPTPPYRVVSASAGWERLCGFPAAAIRGGTLAPIQGPWTDRAAVAKLVHAARNQEAAAVCLINYDHLRRAFEHVVYVDMLRDPSGVTQYIQATSLVLQPPGTCVQPSRFDADDSVEKAFTHAHMLLLASWVEYQALVKHLHISATHPIAEVALIQRWGARRQDALVKKLEESRGNPTTCPDDM